MAVYNGAAYLREAMDSILSQTFRNFEFLVINDGSTDDSRAIIPSYGDSRIRILDNPENIGLTRSLNRGLAEARGELIARQDADDVSHVTRLERQVAFMDAEPEVVAVGTQARFVNASGKAVSAYGWDKLQSDLGLRWQIMFDSAFVHTSVMFRRSIVWGTERGYDETFATSQDFELWSRLSRRNKLRNLPDVLVDQRQHPKSVSASYEEEKIAKIRGVLRANLKANLPDYPDAEEWLDLWIRLNNQGVHTFRDNNLGLLRHILRIRTMFFTRFPDNSSKSEIDWHTAALLLRGAFATAAAGQPGAMRLARQALHYNPTLALAVAPRFAARLVLRILCTASACQMNEDTSPGDQSLKSRSMATPLMSLAHYIYRATPFRGLRTIYFKAFCFAVRRRVVQAEIDGARFELDLGETIDLALYLRQFEPDVVRAIETTCRPGMTAIDIGANIGAHALRLARIVGDSGHLYAFEPTSYAFRKLDRNFSLNAFSHAETFQIALSDENAKDREIRFRSSWRTDGRHHVSTDRIDFMRLDDWCAREGVDQVDLIKLDVDGNEFPIITGGMSVIRRCRPVFVMEAVGPHFENDACNPFAVLAELGYRFRDTKTGTEYSGPEEMRALLPRGDYEMTQSINVIAKSTGRVA